MDTFLVALLLGVALGAGGTLYLRRRRSIASTRKAQEDVRVHAFLENMRSVGELVVFKAYTKEIVTTAENWLGKIGKRYLTWLMSNMKMAMVFQFEISFWYDLKSPDFDVSRDASGAVTIRMPPCLYNISITDISFYDEQSAKFLDWLLPPLLSRVFSKDFTEADKNRLKDEAKLQASSMALRLIGQLSSDIEKSARQTMEMLARSFGARSVAVDFGRSQIQERGISTPPVEKPVAGPAKDETPAIH